ncbi:MAG: NifB/NifX family molybdenum-iron cluster-binding protein [Chloroflexota bacterium]
MRYAIPLSGGKLADHFGHCEHFALFDVDTDTTQIVRKEVVSSPGHEPGLLPIWLAEEGVSAVIASGMGSRAQRLFEQNHIAVVLGAAGDDPERMVLEHVRGELRTGENICDH